MTTMRVVGECFFWYRLTRVFPDKFHRAVKRLCVCVCSFFPYLSPLRIGPVRYQAGGGKRRTNPAFVCLCVFILYCSVFHLCLQCTGCAYVTYYDNHHSRLNRQWATIVHHNPVFKNIRIISAYKRHKNFKDLLTHPRLNYNNHEAAITILAALL